MKNISRCNNVIVNATATRSGGALTILNQLINNIPDDNINYIVFVDKSFKYFVEKKNLQIIKMEKRSYFKRFMWDAFGLKKYLKKHNIEPIAAISLQNTNFKLNTSCPNYIYYHQALPFHPHKWSFFKSKERLFWFYKNIYPFFVNIFINKRTKIFIQLNCTKEDFAKRFHFDENNIYVVFPDIESFVSEPIPDLIINNEVVNLFYPATPLIYKNHQVLFESLRVIDCQLSKKVVLYITCKQSDFQEVVNFNNVQIVFLDSIKLSNVMWLYAQMDAILFPSYIEALGLPLVEAASLGLPILTVDLPYAKEVLKGYSGATFIDYQDAEKWGKEIKQLCQKEKYRYPKYKMNNKKNWNDFFEFIKKNI